MKHKLELCHTRYAHPPFQLPSGVPPASPIARPSADAVVLDEFGALKPHQPRNLMPQLSGRLSEDGNGNGEAIERSMPTKPPTAILSRASSVKMEPPRGLHTRSESADKIQVRPPSAGMIHIMHAMPDMIRIPIYLL
jgi:hypothetical protein